MTTLNLNTEMNTNTKTKRGKVLATLLAGLLALAMAVIFGLSTTTPATGETKAVTFDGIQVNDGGTVIFNGSNSMTVYDGKLISFATNGKLVTASEIDSVLAAWSLQDFGSDPIADSISSGAKLLDIAAWDKICKKLPDTDRSYWLADKKTIAGISVQASRTKKNTIPMGTVLTGATEDRHVWMNNITHYESTYKLYGYSLAQNVTLDSFTWPAHSWLIANGMDKKNSTKCVYAETNIRVTSLVHSHKFMERQEQQDVVVRTEGQEVWNNPWCIDDPDRGFYKTTYKDLSRGFTTKYYSYMYKDELEKKSLRNSYQLKVLTDSNYSYSLKMPGYEHEQINTGDVLMSADIKAEELTDPRGFETANNGYIVNYFKSAGTGYRAHLPG